jgi:hypothetical protein
MLVRARAVAGTVGVLKNPHAFVLEEHLVMLGVADRRVEAAHTASVAGVHLCSTTLARTKRTLAAVADASVRAP